MRARAVGHVADVLAAFGHLLDGSATAPRARGGRGDTDHDQFENDGNDNSDAPSDLTPHAEGYLIALCGVPLMSLVEQPTAGVEAAGPTVPPPGGGGAKAKRAKSGKRSKARRGGQGSDDDGDDGDDASGSDQEGGGGNGGGRGRRAAAARATTAAAAAVYDAVLPSRVVLDLGPLLSSAHRRLCDDKAPVRKAGLALLQAAALLRGALPAPAGAAPDACDVAAVEGATVDPLVRCLNQLPVMVLHHWKLLCYSC